MKASLETTLKQQSVLPMLQYKRFLNFQTIFHKLLSRQKLERRKYLLTTCALDWLHCALWGIIPRRYYTTVEIVYFHPSSCHHSSILLPANTMTLFLRQLGNVLVINPETASLPKHCALRPSINNPSSDHSENKRKKYWEITFTLTLNSNINDVVSLTLKLQIYAFNIKHVRYR